MINLRAHIYLLSIYVLVTMAPVDNQPVNCIEASQKCHIGNRSGRFFYDFEIIRDAEETTPVYCSLSSMNSSITLCQLDVEQVITGVRNDSLLYLVIECPKSHLLKVHFTNKKGIEVQFPYSELDMANCETTLENMGVLGKALKVSTLMLMDWQEHSDWKTINRTSDRPRNQSLSKTSIEGMQDVRFINILRSKVLKHLPHNFYEYKWPNVRTLNTSRIIVGHRQLNLLQLAMPELYNININHNPHFSNEIWKPGESDSVPAALTNRVTQRKEWQLVFINCNISLIQNGQLGGHLKKLNLSHNVIDNISSMAFQNITGLQFLDLSYNKIRSLPTLLFVNLSKVEHLNLGHNKITMLVREHFLGLTGLKKLSVNNNLIQIIGPASVAGMPNLAEVDLAYNKLQNLDKLSIMCNSTSISKIYLNNNKLTDFPTSLISCRYLSLLELARNRLNFKSLIRDVFCSVQARHNAINIAEDDINNAILEGHLDVDLKTKKIINVSYNQLTDVNWKYIKDITKCDFRTMLYFFDWNFTGNKLICDCNAYLLRKHIWQYRGLQNKLYLNSWKCDQPHAIHGLTLTNVSSSAFMCEIQEPNCTKPCTCYELAFDHSIYVNCSNRNLDKLPRSIPSKTSYLDLQGNNIASIGDIAILKGHTLLKVTKVDLSGNNIRTLASYIPALLERFDQVKLNNNDLRSLPESVQGRNLTLCLGGNDFKCDCSSDWFVKWLVDNKEHIPDYDDVHCELKEHGLWVNIRERVRQNIKCRVHIGVKASIGLALLLISLPVIAYIVFKNRLMIKVYIYNHFNLDPWKKYHDNDVIGKRYDAMLVYSTDDLDMVLNEVVPRLECPERGFQLCVHDRNFEYGIARTLNITYALESSRRVILCVTRNFLEDHWCLCEFRLAHAQALRKKNRFIIFLLLEDIEPDEMEADMRVYLQTSSYISWNNKHFWKKVIYYMPKIPVDTLLGDETPSEEFRLPFPSAPTNDSPNSDTEISHISH